MSEHDRPLLVEGAMLKRYRLSYWGQFLGSYDTAAEILAERKKHIELIRPFIDRENKGRYQFREAVEGGRDKEISLVELRRRAAAEEKAADPAGVSPNDAIEKNRSFKT